MSTHPISERVPAQIGGARTLMLAQASARRAFTEMYRQLAGEIGGLAVAYALSLDAPIPAARSRQFMAAAGQVVTRYFVGPDGRNPFGTDGVTPLAAYPRILNEALFKATKLPVVAQFKWLKRHLPEDIFAWMAGAKRKSLQESRVAEDLSDEIRKFYEKYGRWYIFQPNPLAKYERSHKWVDPNGYTLSDRIWRTGTATRTKLDAMLTDAIRNGVSASDLSKMVEAFLLPGRLGKRTKRPYGRDASYDGMRLARTEISRAHNYASYAASAVNPYVHGIDWALSISHPKMDICDDLATIGMGGERLKDPYPVEGAKIPPAHPHCVTPGQLVTTSMGDMPIEQIRAGDYVLTHQGRFCRVVAAWSRQYDGLVHEMETDAGNFELTSEHPVLLSRGWINAKDIQAGDQVLHTGVGAFVDLGLGVADGAPAELSEFGVATDIMFSGMPINTVSLNDDFSASQNKIGAILANSELLHEDNLTFGKGSSQSDFNRREPSKSLPAIAGAESRGIAFLPFIRVAPTALVTPSNMPNVQAHVAHDEEQRAGVVSPLGFGDFATHIWTTRRVIVASDVKPRVGLSHFLACSLAATSVVVCPARRNSFADVAYLQPNMLHNGAKSAELDAETATDFGGTEALIDVEIDQNISNRSTKLRFNATDMRMENRGATTSDAMASAARSATNTASVDLAHNNLLLLSPDADGRGSGNPLVKRIATPSQAHLNYTAIQSIQTRHYRGLVYNMEVEEDNSYTVNGFAVHNCLCNSRPALIDDTAEVTAQLREAIQESRRLNLEPHMNAADADAFTRMLVGLFLNF